MTALDMASRRAGLLARVDELLGRRVSMRSLALLRILAGPVVLLHLRPFLVDAAHGRIYRDAFYQPYVSWYPDLPRSLYIGLLWIGAAAAIAMSAGLWTRLTTVTTFAIVAYNLFLSTTHFHNNRAYLFIVLAALAVAPCGRELSVDAWARGRRGLPPLDPTAPGWPLWLLRFEASAIYGASGLSKLLDPDWFGGAVTWDRVMQEKDRLAATPLPNWVISALTDRTLHTYAAKLIVLTELFIAVGLWWRGTRYAAVWIAVCFHLSIQASADVEIFSYLGIAVLAIWAVPATRDRMVGMDLSVAGQRWLATMVRHLDWLARFRVQQAHRGPVQVVDRAGRVLRGGPAVVFALSRLPVTAWFTLPLLLVFRGAAARDGMGEQASHDPGPRGEPTR